MVGLIRADGVDKRRGGRLPIPFTPIGLEMDAAVDAERHRVAQLLDSLPRAEREDDRVALVGLDQAHSLFHAALLVRAHRETQVLRVDRPCVLGEQDPATGDRHPLDTS